MLNEKFIGIIKSCKAGSKIVKNEDGSKQRLGTHVIKLESSDIDYESMAKWNPNISGTLLNIQPMPFKSVNFGDQSTLNLQVNFYGEEPDEVESRTVTDNLIDESDAVYGNVMITNLSVVITDNIPTLIFTMEIPVSYSGRFLYNSVKNKISFCFSEMSLDV